MKEVIFVILEGFADWEGAYIATCLNQGVKPGNPISGVNWRYELVLT